MQISCKILIMITFLKVLLHLKNIYFVRLMNLQISSLMCIKVLKIMYNVHYLKWLLL